MMNMCLTSYFKANTAFVNIAPGTLIVRQLTISYVKFIIKVTYPCS